MKRKQIIILAILVVLLAIYIIARQQQPVQKQRRFFKADSSAIAKIVLSTPQDTVIMVKKDKEWKLDYPIKWSVNEPQLASFFKRVLPAKTSTTPMSEDHNQQRLYKVNKDTGVQVRLYNKLGIMLDNAYIGNGGESSFDYGRHEGKKEIYQFTDTYTNFVRPELIYWRSPNILDIKRSDVASIDVKYAKGAYTLTVLGDSIRYTDKNESFVISPYNRAQEKVMNAIVYMQTQQFYDTDTDKYKERFKTPDCYVTIHLKNGKTHTLSMITGENNLVIMMLDNNIKPLYTMTFDFINRFTRAAMHYKAEYD